MVRSLLVVFLLLTVFAFQAEAKTVKQQQPCMAVGQSLGKFPDASVVCCQGLKARELILGYQGNCGTGNAPGGYAAVCLACGDGVCEKSLENKCNCPEDCSTY